jgi:hypothetical protein
MMTQLTWSALILAALAAVACWNAEDKGACSESRPVFGGKACCEKHRLAGKSRAATQALLEETRRPVVSPPARP